MTYEEALAFIHGTYKFGSKLGLENIKMLLEKLGSPEKSLKFVHVAGTNGKGSTCALIQSVLIEAGYCTGLYTSPFIETFNERIRVNHTLITSDELAQLTFKVKLKVEEMVREGHQHPTEFEVVTAIAMLYYQMKQCDVVVLEVGLGGRLDATNAIEIPLVSVITPLDYDHMEYLGHTLSAIAGEKAGIIKTGGTTVTYPQTEEAQEVIRTVCQSQKNALVEVSFKDLEILSVEFGSLRFKYQGSPYEIGLFAPYQAENAVVAIEVLKILRNVHHFSLTDEQIALGLKKAKWIGRLEIVSEKPFIIIDGAHNMHGIRGLAKSLDALGKSFRVVGLVGILKDKDVSGMIDVISPYLDRVITTRPDNPRAMSAETLATYFEASKVVGHYESIKEAVEKVYEIDAIAETSTLYLGFGSLYMIGDIRRHAQRNTAIS